MALKLTVVALLISAVAAGSVFAPCEKYPSQTNRQELEYRVEACAKNFPGREVSSFEPSSPEQKCVEAARRTARSSTSPQDRIIETLPQCMRSTRAAESDVTKLSNCLQKNILLPWTWVEGNTKYTPLETFTQKFAGQDCLESSAQVNNKVDELINRTCYDQLDMQYRFGAPQDAINDWLKACLNRAGVDNQIVTDAVKCYTDELKDPTVIQRAADYLALILKNK
ncbi:Retrovirus-related Pol polyprotein from transposon 17.6 [Frankliniella fusca]|uniref:Retrovirus-related Pol polyprotein from transposon 17.6 n=1 Tax=Frankliniella fusca TaxID=407009 RepID=A0AAE1I3P2_9NEOP|nr:Retrovirus-related Pol polyprotein from transposon 17.6 [Frankliniella fusca]